LITSI